MRRELFLEKMMKKHSLEIVNVSQLWVSGRSLLFSSNY